ncbi:hypothetical protein JOD43_001009 [Pullulanibacillus pueri]|uniref:Uncharacterized protein n=1 Tax=Pullulanibacillus pueri TaxID=1437324 RepID=A0A8J2ZV42_9BACL|nr:permease prefix domain 1-containing protein [Pullulanibacillus pueri]MBM7680845.1 hypothetical protein [Pullulanibacillus pueri]GGH78554.1 hypothetical protein GCM10007096_12160 [Pullulanibacillus pueri]
MKDIDLYVNEIVADLPIGELEKEELKEELSLHLHEHVKELMIKGYSNEEAMENAIQSFGNVRALNWQMKKAVFPYYKTMRYLWNAIFVTACIWTIAYYDNTFYHREMGNFFQEGGIEVFVIIATITGVFELAYEAIKKEFNIKWLTNPWCFFLLPSFFISGLLSISFFQNPEKYADGFWIDLFVMPIGALAHLTSRQLFTLIFVQQSKRRHGGRHHI